MGEARRTELRDSLSKYQTEIQQLPQIFKIRIEALKEVNPKEFANSPELILSSLMAAHFIKIVPLGKPTDIPYYIYNETFYDRYNVSFGDISPDLVSDLFWRYVDDIKNGAIDKNGNVLDITKSKVMTVFHCSRKNGIPMDAKETVAKYQPKPTICLVQIICKHNSK